MSDHQADTILIDYSHPDIIRGPRHRFLGLLFDIVRILPR